jgi:hypothetical protein
VRFVRVTVEPEAASELLDRRRVLIDEVRSRFGGLVDARLVRLDERTWVDVWHWESAAAAEAAAAARLPAAAHAFALASEVHTEDAELVDRR